MNWYYVDGPQRVGPLTEADWETLVRSGKIIPTTLVWHEGMPTWTAYEKVTQVLPAIPLEESVSKDEIGDESQLTDDRVQEPVEVFLARIASNDYEVNTGDCISRAWTLLKSHFWILVGSTTLIWAIVIVGSLIPVLGWALEINLQGVLFGGLFNVYFLLMRGKPTAFADLFAGFTPPLFGQLALQTLTRFAISNFFLIPYFYAVHQTGINFFAQNTEELTASMETNPQGVMIVLLVFMACSIPVVYFTFCWMFSLPLMLDKHLRFWPAMQLSRSKVLMHPWKISVFAVVAGLAGFVGAILLGIGVIFTLPIYFVAVLYLYEDIFNKPSDLKRG